ncbi:MAG: hypothetical protein ACRDVG_10310 [Jatrophihabitantaceae bacterium]
MPWVLFSVISRHDTMTAASVVALGAAIVVAIPGVRARRPKILEIGTIFAFVGLTAAAVAVDPGHADWLQRYARAIAAALLATIALISVVTTPFTEQYARQTVPPQYWSSARFKQINRELTLLWAIVFVAMVPSHIVAGYVDTRRSNTIFNWVIPIALVVFAAKRTEKAGRIEDTPDRALAHQRAAALKTR